MKFKTVHVFLLLSALFLYYSMSIYFKPLTQEIEKGYDKAKATDGRLVWQNYNCQSCHQLYGLGGYLGPDLTNIISKPMKGEAVIKAMVTYGTRQMPPFNLSSGEMENLIEFLKSTDASGTSDPRHFVNTNFGLIENANK